MPLIHFSLQRFSASEKYSAYALRKARRKDSESATSPDAVQAIRREMDGTDPPIKSTTATNEQDRSMKIMEYCLTIFMLH